MVVMPDPQQVGVLWNNLQVVPTVLYVGPDQIMPLTSILGVLVGIALMFWNRLVGFVQKCRALLTRTSDTPNHPVKD